MLPTKIGCLDGIWGISVGGQDRHDPAPLSYLLSDCETGGSDIPELGAVDDDLEGPLAGQLRDLSEQWSGQVGSADDEGLAGVHRLGSAEDGRMTQTVGDSGRINGRLREIVLSAAAAAANLGLGQLFDGHGETFLSSLFIGAVGAQ